MKLLCILDSGEFPLAPPPAIARRAAALLLEEKSISGSAALHTTHEQLARQLSSAR